MDRFLLSSVPENVSMGSFWDSFDINTDVNQTIPLIDEEPTDYIAGNKNAATIFLLVFLWFFFIGCAIYGKKALYANNEEETDEEAGAEGGRPLAVKICYMTAEERMALYNEAFDRNKHQIVMDASSIIVGNPEAKRISDSEEEEEGTQGTCDDSCDDSENFDEDPSIYLALKDARAFRRSTMLRRSVDVNGSVSNAEDGINNGEKRRQMGSSIVHPRRHTSNPVDIEQGNPPADEDDIVRGNCVICFEDIKAGETVVWSETRSCNHVYHKDCMVAYLAHKKQSIKEIELDLNPCPTCRQKFVTVCTPVPQEKSS